MQSWRLAARKTAAFAAVAGIQHDTCEGIGAGVTMLSDPVLETACEHAGAGGSCGEQMGRPERACARQMGRP